jgi:serine/threonine-protein phosphatase PP1 catalytic subunit
MHGGLSPDLNSMEQIRRVMRPTDVSSYHTPMSMAVSVSRPILTSELDPRLWSAVRSAVVRSRQGHNRLERERPRCFLHIWA